MMSRELLRTSTTSTLPISKSTKIPQAHPSALTAKLVHAHLRLTSANQPSPPFPLEDSLSVSSGPFFTPRSPITFVASCWGTMHGSSFLLHISAAAAVQSISLAPDLVGGVVAMKTGKLDLSHMPSCQDKDEGGILATYSLRKEGVFQSYQITLALTLLTQLTGGGGIGATGDGTCTER
ncbi:uncharacterized protein EI97DRAFT_264192 [Westerdykella ornata]|uniref:Uncharacterized protein n=1 Tax=Westerdykella ornata TaxID=318751 RepID=A0A6A6J4N8_WESOR|nr:uncharacterized protein EI97DRAFT_264192 [Westerdykella ornata]KAF2271541.1 hypothetical protein EI97DRAFT_264192 [Westerdykella ornata]